MLKSNSVLLLLSKKAALQLTRENCFLP